MTINNKSERNYRGKCLGWPVTSYGSADDWLFFLEAPNSTPDTFVDSQLVCFHVMFI